MNILKYFICSISLLVSFIMPALSFASTQHAGQLNSLKAIFPGSFNVYVTGPENASRGILLIHGWQGLNNRIKQMADQFGSAGYRAMAIDLYKGQVAMGPNKARALMETFNQIEANAKYVAAIKTLKANGRDVAVIGWGFGGSQAMHATLAANEMVSATVSYYPFGEMPAGSERLSQMQGPLLIQVGDKDFFFTKEKIEAYKFNVQKAGKTLVVKTYNARHSFDKNTSDNYNQTAEEQAWFSTNNFLDRYLD